MDSKTKHLEASQKKMSQTVILYSRNVIKQVGLNLIPLLSLYYYPCL